MFLITFPFTFIYFEDFQILIEIHYYPNSLYKALKSSIFQYEYAPNIILTLKFPSNIWMIIALYPPIVQVVECLH